MAYHINPNTGDPGICRAGNGGADGRGCPWGSKSEHYENPNDARAAFEAKMSGETLQAHTKLYKPRENDSDSNVGVKIEKLPSESQTPAEIQRAEYLKKFEEADKIYNNSLWLDQEDSAGAYHSGAEQAAMAAERDKYAARIGTFTTQDLSDAINENRNFNRRKELAELPKLRGAIKSREVGKGTERYELYVKEDALLRGYEPSKDTIPAKELTELKRSVEGYRLDDYTKRLNDLGPVNVFSSSDKKKKAADLRAWISDAQNRILQA